MQLTQASTALSIVVPAGAAVGVAGQVGMLRSWGFTARDTGRAVTLTSLWNQFLNLSFPIVAVFMLTIAGEKSAALATAAFIGVAVLGIVVGGFVLVLLSNGLARDIGDVAARFTNWSLAKVRRHRLDPDHARWDRSGRARADRGAPRLRRQQRRRGRRCPRL